MFSHRGCASRHRDAYSEGLVLLPEYYLTHSLPAINRHVWAHGAGSSVSRSDFGFAHDDVLLASFLQPYKIERRVFQVAAVVVFLP